MKHLGDITKINGHDVPLVDVICGGSPCQDLSVAGLRKGLQGERSGLFMEQIRIIKEMRDESTKQLSMCGADKPIRPRFMVWENVPGAFSSNQGEDFRAVLEETAKIADESAVVPRLERGGRWSYAGCIMGKGWSVAWRTTDNQFWGTPQRRRRISLVGDFGGESAPKILFEREGLPGPFSESREEGQEIARNDKASVNQTSYTLKIRGGVEIDSHGKKAGKGALIQTELSATLGVSQDQTLINLYSIGHDIRSSKLTTDEKTDPLTACDYKDPIKVISDSAVRKLTPMEAERLQGYPDGWTNIGDWTDSKGQVHKGDTDTPRYRALGNSIALPYWSWMAERMVNQLKEDGVEKPTMASLFDGIGGFPLVYSRHGCEPIWASEIEEFPIAVTKMRFPEGEEE